MMKTTTGVEFRFPEAGPDMFTLTCANHQDGRWLTKNPATRSLHWIGWATDPADEHGETCVGNLHPEFTWRECPCPFGDLRVLENETYRRVETDRRTR